MSLFLSLEDLDDDANDALDAHEDDRLRTFFCSCSSPIALKMEKRLKRNSKNNSPDRVLGLQTVQEARREGIIWFYIVNTHLKKSFPSFFPANKSLLIHTTWSSARSFRRSPCVSTTMYLF